MSVISVLYAALGDQSGFLGKALDSEKASTKDTTWRFRRYEHGALYSSPAAEAQADPDDRPWVVPEHIRNVYQAFNWEQGLLGFPVENGHRTLDGIGECQAFDDGRVFWHPATGGFEVHGLILEKYFGLLGGPTGPLGYPTSNEQTTPGDPAGRFSTFQHGAIYWSPGTRARAVWGPVFSHWTSLGGFGGSGLGYPITDVMPSGTGNVMVRFQHGTIVRPAPLTPVTPGGPTPGPAPSAFLPVGAKLDYHDATAADHRKQVALLPGAGCRLVTLGIYGDPADPRYVARWAKEQGPKQSFVNGLGLFRAREFVDDSIENNAHPTIVVATGTVSAAIFAVVCEARTGPAPIVKLDLKNGSAYDIRNVGYWNSWARQNGYRPAWLQRYGEPSDPRYVGIWEHNPEGLNWRTEIDLTGADHQVRLDVQKLAWARPAFVTRTSEDRHTVLYLDDDVDTVVEKHDLAGSNYATELKTQRLAGLDVASVSASQAGKSPPKLDVVFTQRRTRAPRTWRVTGQSVPSLAAFDEVARRFMTLSRTRAGSLAISKDGHLVYARAFTLAESDYPTTQPTSLFRFASCTKPIVGTTVMRLAENEVGGFTLNNLNDHVQDTLNLEAPLSLKASGKDIDSEFKLITIMQLLVHRAGTARNGSDQDKNVLDAIKRQFPRRTYPITTRELVSHLATWDLQSTPGTATAYSNVGYYFLGYLIEKLTGKTFDDAVREQIFTPLGLKRPGVTGSLLSTQRPGESRYPDELLRYGPSVMTPDQPFVPIEYGTKNWNTTAGAGSLVFAPADYTKILDVLGAGLDVTGPGQDTALLKADTVKTRLWALPPGSPDREPGGQQQNRNGKLLHTHGGTNVGSNALMAYVPQDKLAIVWAWNGGHEYTQVREQLLDTAEAITSWPTHDLYLSLTIPEGIPGPV